MTPAMGYKAATGLRARGDLSPNVRVPASTRALRVGEILRAGQFLAGLAKLQPLVTLNRTQALRIADALIDAHSLLVQA